MSHRTLTDMKLLMLAGILACGTFLSEALARGTQVEERSLPTASALPPPAPTRSVSPSFSAASSTRATMMYKLRWGVDDMVVRAVSSGLMLRFSYLVVDAEKARVLNDKKNTPYLIDEASGIKMEVPTMEKIGQLRQTVTPENGRQYWMVFSNRAWIKPGSRVDIVIGNFRVNGLVVESAEPALLRKSRKE